MPADRLLHPRAGRSHKVTALTDMEYRVWTQYLLSADDFGVMHATVVALQNDNLALARKPQRAIRRCLEALVVAGLVTRFEHQDQPYLCQHDWQRWQKVEYPRSTINPAPPSHILERFEGSTQTLFEKHPGGQRKAARSNDEPSNSGRTSQEHTEGIPPTRAGAPAKRPTANANGIRQTADGSGASIIPRRRKDAAFEGPRVYVPQRCHSDFVALRGSDSEQVLFDWYERISNEWFSGARKFDEPGPDMFAFWKARYAEQWPATPTAPLSAPSAAELEQRRNTAKYARPGP